MIQQSLSMEFVVLSAVKPLTGILNEVLEQSSFRIEPYRRLSSANAHKYQVFFVPPEQAEQTPCGWLEFIASRPGKTTVRLEPQRATSETGENNDMLMTRLFYLFVQRLVQLEIVVAGKNNLANV